MPSEDEIRRYQREHPVSPVIQELLAGVPRMQFDPAAARRQFIALFQQEYMQTPPEPDKDYPYQKDTAPMTRLDVLNRALTAAALVALAVTLGVWLTRSAITAAPPAAPVIAPLPSPARTRPAEAVPEPTLAPVPVPVPAPSHTVTTEVEISYEIAPPAKTETPAETPKANHQPSGRRGWFRRR